MDIENELKKYKIQRDKKHCLGKRISCHLWIHKNYVNDIFTEEEFMKFHSKVPTTLNYNILRIDLSKNEIAFICCNDFDTSNEPIVGDSIRITKEDNYYSASKINKQPQNPLIYHHKWLFVKDNYKGFNVEKSKERSLEWKRVLGVDKKVSSRIGRLSFWNDWLHCKNITSRISISKYLKNNKKNISKTNKVKKM